MKILSITIVAIFFLVNVGAAATFYIDPTCSNNGDGTSSASCAGSPGGVGPFNTWSGISFSAGNTYAQKAGTTFTNAAAGAGTIAIAASGTDESSRIVLTRYGTGDDPKVNGAGSTYGIRISGTRSFVTIDHFEVYGVNTGSGANRFGILLCNDANPCTSIRVTNVTIHDIEDPGGSEEADGIWGNCGNCVLDHLTIYNIPSDGIWFRDIGNFTLTNSYIYNVGTSGRGTGDGVQLEQTSISLTITDNIIDHRTVASKQALNDSTTGGTGGLVARNTFYMTNTGAFKNVFMTTPNLLFQSNAFIGGWRCLSYNKNGTMVGNLFRGCYEAGFLSEEANRTQYFINNTFDGLNDTVAKASVGVDEFTAGASTTLYFYNNIFTNFQTAIFKHGSATATDRNNLFYNNDANGITLDGSNLTSNPLYINMVDGGDFRTQATSSARRAGRSGYLCADVRGRACYPDYPDIGAYQATRGDPAAARTARQ